MRAFLLACAPLTPFNANISVILFVSLGATLVETYSELLPERPTQVNSFSETADRSTIKREMARARDDGPRLLLSLNAFVSKSNYTYDKFRKWLMKTY